MNKFVVIEGGDGVGKSTQIRLLEEYCKSRGIDAVFTREPGGTPISEAIRGILLDSAHGEMSGMTELMLYAAARAQHIEQFIAPMLKAGKIVFCDRFTASTIAYQGVARGLALDAILRLDSLAVGGCAPDLTVFLDAHPKDAALRKIKRVEVDRIEREGEDFQARVYEGYAVAEGLIKGFIRIDASGQKHETHQKVVEALAAAGVF